MINLKFLSYLKSKIFKVERNVLNVSCHRYWFCDLWQIFSGIMESNRRGHIPFLLPPYLLYPTVNRTYHKNALCEKKDIVFISWLRISTINNICNLSDSWLLNRRNVVKRYKLFSSRIKKTPANSQIVVFEGRKLRFG